VAEGEVVEGVESGDECGWGSGYWGGGELTSPDGRDGFVLTIVDRSRLLSLLRGSKSVSFVIWVEGDILMIRFGDAYERFRGFFCVEKTGWR